MTYVYDDRTNEILFEGTREQCIAYITNNYDDYSEDFNHIWIK